MGKAKKRSPSWNIDDGARDIAETLSSEQGGLRGTTESEAFIRQEAAEDAAGQLRAHGLEGKKLCIEL